jgi:hypothetical protein
MRTPVVAYIGRHEVHTGILWGNPEQRDHLEDASICGRIIEKLILKE